MITAFTIAAGKSVSAACGELPDEGMTRCCACEVRDEFVEPDRIFGFADTVPAVRAGYTQIVSTVSEFYRDSGGGLQRCDHGGHFFMKTGVIAVSAVILYAQKVVRAKMQDRSPFGMYLCHHCLRNQTAGSPA